MAAKKPADKAGAKRRGRPSKFTAEICAEICERLAEGEPMARICSDEHMPHVSNVWELTQKDADFSVSIARARQDGGHAIAHRTRETARGRGDSTGDYLRDKLIIDTDLRLLSKWFPKDYGDKIDVNATVAGEIRIVVGGDTQ